MPELSEENGYLFKIVVDGNDLQGSEAAEQIYRLGYSEAAILSVDTDYGKELKEIFIGEYNNLGGKIVANETYKKGETDLRTHIVKIKASKSKVLFIASDDPKGAGYAIAQADELKLTGLLVVGSKDLESPEMLETAGKAAEGVLVLYIQTKAEGPIHDEFVNDYVQKFGEDPGEYSGEAYDGITALAVAIKESHGYTEGIIDALHDMSFEGAIGTVKFDADGDLDRHYTLVQFENGVFVPFE